MTELLDERGSLGSRRLGGIAWPLALPVLRVIMVGLACTAAWLVTLAATGGGAFPPPTLVAVVAMLPVNVACLWLVARLVRRDGGRLRDLVGARRGHVLRDILWGVLWLFVLYIPFSLTIVLTMWLLHGDETLARFETAFFDAATLPPFDTVAWSVLAIIAVITFAPLNAPAEEFVYRGYAQRGLTRRLPVWVGIGVPAAIYALQHVFYAPTPDAVVVFVAAFFVWGLGAGIIAHRQGRLLPIIVAHGLVNLLMTLPALVIPFVATGVTP